MASYGVCPECGNEIWDDDPQACQDPLTFDWYHAACLQDRIIREEQERSVDGEN